MITIKKAEILTGKPGRTIRHWCQRGLIASEIVGNTTVITITEKQLKRLLQRLARLGKIRL